MSLKTALVLGLPLAYVLNGVYQKAQVLGIGKGPVEGYNNHQCFDIPGLEACEDVWIHQEAGLAYLYVMSCLTLTPPHF